MYRCSAESLLTCFTKSKKNKEVYKETIASFLLQLPQNGDEDVWNFLGEEKMVSLPWNCCYKCWELLRLPGFYFLLPTMLPACLLLVTTFKLFTARGLHRIFNSSVPLQPWISTTTCELHYNLCCLLQLVLSSLYLWLYNYWWSWVSFARQSYTPTDSVWILLVLHYS